MRLRLTEEDTFVGGLVFGRRIYGHVDSVPGVLHVATFFFHIFLIPLVPRDSVIFVIDNHGYHTAQNTLTPLNAKSVLVAWVRAFLIVLALTSPLVGPVGSSWVFAVLSPGSSIPPAVVLAGLFGTPLLALIAYAITKTLDVATPLNAELLAVKAGFPPGVIGSLSRNVRDGGEMAELPCPFCGRLLSRRSRICPRCERKIP
jgi:hypothetical protein